MDDTQIKTMVRERYGSIAAASGGPSAASCCAPVAAAPPVESCGAPASALSAASCCAPAAPATADEKSRRMGYSDVELAAVPEGANLGLGCGNPQAIASIRPGETVIDLGSGAGFDCFLAAQQVGPAGRVIGVDMTHEMLAKARANAARIGAANVEFRLGELEHLPVADNTADVVISNCVINLVPDKARVFREAFRVLKPGGRLAVSDVVNTAPLPQALAADRALLCGCVAGAAPAGQVAEWLEAAGFAAVCVTPKQESREMIAGGNSWGWVDANMKATKSGAVRSGVPPMAFNTFAASVRCSISSTATTRRTWKASELLPGRIEYSAVRYGGIVACSSCIAAWR